MGYTLTQKKQAMKPIIDRCYAPVLEQAGFQSYNGEGFHWYKIEDGLLKKIHMPYSSDIGLFSLQIGFGAIPLFSWESIPAGLFANEWGRMFSQEGGHFIWAAPFEMENIRHLLGRSFPEKPVRAYFYPRISHYTKDGLLIDHLDSEACGAELVTDLIIPSLQKLNTLKRVYDWNKLHVYQRLKCTNDQELCRILQDKHRLNNTWFLTATLADQCIYFHETALYLGIRYLLKDYIVKRTAFLESTPPKTKKHLNEELEIIRHLQTLLSGLESGDEDVFRAERERVAEMMTAQIKAKMPSLLN